MFALVGRVREQQKKLAQGLMEKMGFAQGALAPDLEASVQR